MFTALTRIGIEPKIQNIFASSILTDNHGNLTVSYPDGKEEIFGVNKHIVPKMCQPWLFKKEEHQPVTDVYIFENAIESICFLQDEMLRGKAVVDKAAFLAIGKFTQPSVTDWLLDAFPNTKYHLVFPNTILGRVLDCHIAARLTKKTLKITHFNETIFVEYQSAKYDFDDDLFTLDALKKQSGFPFNQGRTHKAPRPFKTFLEYYKEKSITRV